MWRLISALFIFMSLATTVWLSYELDLFGTPAVQASEKTAAPEASSKESSVDSLARQLEGRGKAIDERELELAKRERELKDKQVLMDSQVQRYEKIIADLKGKLADLEKIQDARVDSFRRVYEKMEAKKAARILNDLDVTLAAQIVAGMKPDHAASVLGEMASEKARLITEKILSKRPAAHANVAGDTTTKDKKTGQ